MIECTSEQDLTFNGIINHLKAHVAHSCAAMYNRRNRNPWYRLFTAIEEEAKTGKSMYVFDEEFENVHFVEDRKIVKQKLEELGYHVSYQRVKDSDDYYYPNSFHNRYTISW